MKIATNIVCHVEKGGEQQIPQFEDRFDRSELAPWPPSDCPTINPKNGASGRLDEGRITVL